MNLINKVKLARLKRRIRTVGDNLDIRFPCKIHGAECILIGSEFYSGSGLRLEAWQVYRDQSFHPLITIKDKVRININCHISAINSITIEDNVLIGSNVLITDHNHGNVSREERDIPPNERKLCSKGGVLIKQNCWIGDGAVILSGVTLGKGVIVGANTVVTKSVSDYAVVTGVPGVVRKILD